MKFNGIRYNQQLAICFIPQILVSILEFQNMAFRPFTSVEISRINFQNGGIFDHIWLHLNKVRDEQKTPILSTRTGIVEE